jgi:hypothetical protein
MSRAAPIARTRGVSAREAADKALERHDGAGLASRSECARAMRARRVAGGPNDSEPDGDGQTDIGLVRKSNEDAFAIADLQPVPGAANRSIRGWTARGAVGRLRRNGGHQSGEVASALVVESLRRSMASQAGGGASDALLEKATLQANREVWQAAHDPGREHMGATLTALFVQDKTAYIAEGWRFASVPAAGRRDCPSDARPELRPIAGRFRSDECRAGQGLRP